jgi:hypothetical protein
MKTRIPLFVCAVVGLVAGSGGAQDGNADRLTRPFGAGGTVNMKLSAGEYRIEGTPDDAIHVRWRTRSREELKRSKVAVIVEGSSATIQTRGPREHFQVMIEVPERTDLLVRLSAGDLQIRRIEGHKDVDVWAGDLTIAIGDPDTYRRIDASVRAGDLSVGPLGVNKGGLFRSVRADGKGKYDLLVKLFAGDLKLVR